MGASLVQPYLPSLELEGSSASSTSAASSPAVRKQPAAGDFRVQKVHGGRYEAVNADEDSIGVGEDAFARLRRVTGPTETPLRACGPRPRRAR